MSTDNTLNLDPFKHQSLLLRGIEEMKDISYFFLIGGYGCGKSFSGVLLVLYFAQKFQGHIVNVGIGGTSQTLLRHTLLSDLFKVLNQAGIKYHHNKQEHSITIGTVTFIYINCSDPNNIYGYNFTAFIFDELDELPQNSAIEAFKAVQERVRVLCPDGRKSIFVGLTTAQGIKGCYHILRLLRSSGNKYYKVRGLTKDNTTLDRAYVDKLYSLYSPEEREAFLEGKFVNLSTGRVYKDFDERIHTYNSSERSIPLYNPIYIGQDLNSGFSKAVCIYKEGDILYICKEYSFEIVGDAPRIFRTDFPGTQVHWYPDASSKEIMSGYLEEIRTYSIVLHQMPRNPSINERIMVVNKLFKTGRLKISQDCKELIVALKTRQFDDTGKPEKGKGPTDPDHICDALEYVVWNLMEVKSLSSALKELLSD